MVTITLCRPIVDLKLTPIRNLKPNNYSGLKMEAKMSPAVRRAGVGYANRDTRSVMHDTARGTSIASFRAENLNTDVVQRLCV